MGDFLSGWNDQLDRNQRARDSNQRADMGQLQQFNTLQGILANAKAQKEEEGIKGILAQSQGDPAKAVQGLVQFGSPRALDMASKLKGMMPKPAEPYTLAPGGQRRGLNNELLAEAPMRPDKEQNQSNLARLYQEMSALPQGDPQRAAYQNAIRKESETAKQISPTVIMPRAEQPPVAIMGPDGKPTFVNRADAIGKQPWNASVNKVETAKKKTVGELNQAIMELQRATADGGLIDKSTGSGAGALVDSAAGFFGAATPGSIAVGQMAPIFDLALKMVPRFEGPQSDKDTKSYQEAAGKLANPNTPNATKKAAGREVLRLMQARREQFISKDLVGTEADTGQPAPQGEQPKPARRSSDWKDL